MIKNVNLLFAVSLLMTYVSFAQSKDYATDKNGNVNVNIIDRKVIVDDKVVRTIPEGEPIKAEVGDIGAEVNGDDVSANIGGIGAEIKGDSISVNVGGVLNQALKNINSKDDKDEKEFFKGDFFDD